MAGTLYLVGTPIGNLADTSDRARETLASVDLVAAEDTRRTRKLLAHFGIGAETISLYDANERNRTPELVEALRAGKDVAVVSDAGMPGLSDPGFRIVRACVDAGIDVTVVPGASAAVSALLVSGLPTDRFVFEGFLPRRAGDRRARLEALATEPRTIVLFESPRRVSATLRDVVAILGDRRVAIARELTKLHEEVLRGPASELLAGLDGRVLKGEVVLVVEGLLRPAAPDVVTLVGEAEALLAGGMRKRQAASEVARRHGASANEIYRALLSR